MLGKLFNLLLIFMPGEFVKTNSIERSLLPFIHSFMHSFICLFNRSFIHLGTEQSLFYNMAGAKRNRAATFIDLTRGGSTPF